MPQVLESTSPLTPSSSWLSQALTPKRLQIAGLGLVASVLVATGYIVLFAPHNPKDTAKAAVPRTPHPTATPTPTPVYAPLTGLPTDAAAAAQPVVGVMIENLYPDARPQSGLKDAGVVYEALAEGGITRFLAIFQEPAPLNIGPVRSLRPYYLDWGLEYNIPVAHAGGSEPALAAVGPLGLKDINALVYDGSYFVRTRDRVAPHNLYTTQSLLAQVVSKLGFANPPDFKPVPRTADHPASPAPHPTINIAFSTNPYAVKYQYDAASNSYARFMGGAAHMDRNTNTQIMVKNVVVEFVPTSYGTQSNGKPETDYALIGKGNALVFEDGNATAATWSKADDHSPTTLIDAAGKPITFNRGNTWYSVVPTGNSVTY